MIDLIHFQEDKGGNLDVVRESQKKRGASVELVDEVAALFAQHKSLQYEQESLRRDVNLLQKEIGIIKKAKGDATELLEKKAALDKQIAELANKAAEALKIRDKKAGTIGNIVDPACHVSLTEDDNPVKRLWHPEPNHKGNSELLTFEDKTEGILSHHEVLARLEAYDTDRGVKIAGHRGYFLTNDGVDLNLALINYGLDFLRKKQYKKVQAPFMMKKEMMAMTAQLEEFDEALYGISGESGDDKYLIATSEQPISAMFAEENIDPKALPMKLAGYSTCFRKEAGSHGRDTWGIFRVHQFEKVEQFVVCDPESSPAMLDMMVENSREFYESLEIPYRVVNIVSGGLNNAASIKYDLEAWFPYQGEYKELVSCSNCTDYQSRSLGVRYGYKKSNEKTGFVHMLNGTLCATERALCCLVENYQTPEGIRIPKVLQPYMQGRDFLPFTAELPKASTKKEKK